MAGIRFLTDVTTQEPIQFQNNLGADAGKIAMDGNDLVLSNAVGDILFGDTGSDIYIGDGVSSVDILFEQDGAIRGETGSSVTLTLGSSDTTLSIYAPKITNLSTQSSEATALMINGSNVVGTRELGSAAFSATSAFLGATAKAADSNLLDGIDSSKFLRSDVDDTFGDATKTLTIQGVVRSNNNGNVFGANFNVSTTNKDTAEYAYSVDRSGTVVGGITIGGQGVFADTLTVGSASFSAATINLWNTAYGWGDHGSAGYLTSVAFSDLTSTPTTLAGYGITDSLQIGTTASTALAGNTAVGDTNVQSDWNATSGDAFIQNKPTIPSGNAVIDWTVSQTEDIHADNYTNTTYSVGDGGLTQKNFTTALKDKLDGIEANATADQTAAQILTAIKTVDGSGSGLDADTLDGVNSSSFLRSDANDTLSSTLKVTGSVIYENNTSSGYIPFPKGAMKQTSASGVTGAIKIKLPTHGTADMMTFVVEIYDYASNESVTVFIAGYLYQTTNNNEWNNCTARVLANQTGKDYTVRFGADGSNNCVWIGETNSAWSYPQVMVRDFFAAFSADIDAYNDNWEISFVTSFDTVDETRSDNLPAADWDRIESKPSTFAPSAHTQAWSTITSTPTTISGYGITDALEIGTTATTALAGNTVVGDTNVQSDWNATTGDALILNKPSIPVSGTDFDPVGTDNSTDVTLVTTNHDYLSISGQAITLDAINLDDINGGATAGILTTNTSGVISIDTNTYLTSYTESGNITTADSATNAFFAVPFVSTTAGSGKAVYKDANNFYYNPSTNTLQVGLLDLSSYGTAAAPAIRWSGDGDTGIFSGGSNSNVIGFSTQGTEKMRLDASGNLGINVTSPLYKLDVGGTIHVRGNSGTLIRTVGSNNTDQTIIRVSNSSQQDDGDYGFSIKYMGTRSGNLNSLSIFSDGQQAASQTEAITIAQNGIVGFTNASPTATVDIGGTLKASGAVTFSNYGAGFLKTDADGDLSVDSSTYLTSVAFSDLTSTPTTISGYGITDAFDGAYSSLTGTPSTFAPSAHNQAWSTITSTPTTISGYGITDAFDGAYSSLSGTPTIPSGNAIIDWTVSQTEDIHADNYTDTTYTVGDGGLTQKNFTTTLKTKLDGIATGAEVNVQSDWNATTGDAFIQNKPTLFDGAYSSLTGTPTLDNYVEWYLSGDADSQDITSGKWVKFEGASSITGAGTEASPYIVDLSGINTDTQYSVGDGGLTEKNFTTARADIVDSFTRNVVIFNPEPSITEEQVKIGVGVANPQRTLTVDNEVEIQLNGYTDDKGLWMTYRDIEGVSAQYHPSWIKFNGDYASYSIIQNGNNRMHIAYQTGNVGIHNTNPSEVLTVGGNILASGDITAYSDSRIKENIKTLPNALESVKQMRGVTYNKIGEEKQSIGVIAQEVQSVLPELVSEHNDGMLSVAYGNITGVLIEAIKEQQKQIEELKAQLDGITK